MIKSSEAKISDFEKLTTEFFMIFERAEGGNFQNSKFSLLIHKSKFCKRKRSFLDPRTELLILGYKHPSQKLHEDIDFETYF